MDPELLDLLSRSGDIADLDTQAKLRLLRAKELRTPQDGPALSGLGGLASAIGSGLGAWRGGQWEQSAQDASGRAGALRQSLMQRLPTQPADAGQARALSRSLTGSGDPRLAEVGKGYDDQAGAMEKDALALRTDTRVRDVAAMNDKLKRDLDKAYKGIPMPDGRVFKLNQESGEWEIVGERNSKPTTPGGGGAGRAPFKFKGEDGRWYAWDQTPNSAPYPIPEPTAQGPGAAPTGSGVGASGPDAVTKLTNDTKYLTDIAARLPALESFSRIDDVPGIGPVDKLKPGWALSGEGVKARQDATAVLNALIYEATGKAINEAETLRKKIETGFGLEATGTQFREGVKALRAYVERSARMVNSRSPSVVKLARERGVLRDLEPYLAAPPAADPTGVPPLIDSKEKYDALPVGAEYLDGKTNPPTRKRKSAPR